MASGTHMATTTVRVEGMTCGSCTSSVEKAFKDVDGAGDVSISLVMERAVIQHDPQRLSAEQIQEIIENRGFDAEILSTDTPPALRAGSWGQMASHLQSGISTTTLTVHGMTCGACTSSVESGFADVDGVHSVNVSLLAERAVVEHDASIIKPEALVEIIENRGFDAAVLENKSASLLPPDTAMGGLQLGQRELATTTVSITGMTCGSCTSAVEGGFKNVDGILQFNISLLAERAVIVHNPSVFTTAKILDTISDRGFDAEILSTVSRLGDVSSGERDVLFKVFGMTSSASATALEDALRLLPGVSAAVVTLSTSRIKVTHDPSLIGVRSLVEAIESLGFNALLADSDDNSAQLESLAKTREIQEWKHAFWYSLSFAIPVFLISMLIPMTIPKLDFGAHQLMIPGLYLGDLICLILTVPVQFGVGKRFYVSSYKSLRHGSPTMDVLVTLGTSAAFSFSIIAMTVSILIHPHSKPHTLFETSTMLISFITLGRYLENRAKGQTSKALSRLMSLAPSMATIYADPIAAQKAAEDWDVVRIEKLEAGTHSPDQTSNSMQEKSIPTELLEVGDIVILRPGGQVPADGAVVRGQSYFNESMVTGEAAQIMKRPGSDLMAGTVNGVGRVDFRVTRAGRDTQLSQIVKLVQEAQTRRAPIQRMADIVAGYFVPIIMGLGLLTFLAWLILSHILPKDRTPEVFLKPESGGRFMVCLKLCISVIVFACPCALGLSTPTAVMVGTGVGAENGILVKGGAALETATRIRHVVFDKTGTLTSGKMGVAETEIESLWVANDWRRRLWWSLVALTEMSSEHPIGKAIMDAARKELNLGSEDAIDGSIRDFEAVVGKGVSANVEPSSSVERKRYAVLVGNSDFLTSKGIRLPPDILSGDYSAATGTKALRPSLIGTTPIFIAIDDTYAGSLSLADTIKPTAAAAIIALSHMKITTSLVTGDQKPTALAIAARVGIPATNVHAGVAPHEKQRIIKDIQEGNVKVAMVGDGINDSPALATAEIGIALSSGTDVAMEAADVVLMRPDDLLAVPAAFSLSRTIFNRIKLNLLWACLYNIIGLPFAMGVGLVLPGHIMLPPMAAGAAMAASSVSVVGSSLLLKLWKRPGWIEVERLEKMGLKEVKMKGMKMSAGSRGALSEARSLFNNLRGQFSHVSLRPVGTRGRVTDYVPLHNVDV